MILLMKAHINNSLIAQIKVRPQTYDIRDTKLTGFVLRVNSSGKLVYRCNYERGKWITIGKVDLLSPVQAREKALILMAQNAQGTLETAKPPKIKNPTLADFINNDYSSWLLNAKKGGRKSVDLMKIHFKDFMNLQLNDIKPALLEKWRITAKKINTNKPKAHATINRDIGRLKSALSKAVEWEIIDKNPLAKLKALKIDILSVTRYLSEDEEQRLRIELFSRNKKLLVKQNDNVNTFGDYLMPMVLISINTGLRQGELFDLTWTDLDFNNATLTVRGHQSKSGKTRHIPLNYEALNSLLEWKKQSKQTKLVFEGKNGQRFTSIKKSWQNLLKKAHINNFRWHDLRHDFASKLTMAGVDLNTIRELLGHADLTMTLRYAHLSPEHKANAVAKLLR